MDEAADRPKWLLELENRKRKPRLAHEAGAGSPCMVCNNACPGLDLHFWRKICKNCKCSRDDHDVQDDDFPQFHLLFGPSNKYKKKSMFLRVNEKQVEAETVFEWVPPDTTKELASDYMKALPVDKLPIKGTTGAALRRQLLQKQLPLHDIDYKTCDELSDDEKKQFEKYLENIKKYVGQGKVTKILSARPFDRALLTPANATEMQQYSPEHRKAPNSNIAQLRTPSSFTKLAYGKNLANSYNNPDYQSSAEAECLKNDSGKAPTLELYTTINNPKDTAIATSEPIGNDVVRTASPFLRDRIAQHHDANANCSSLTEPGRKEDNTPSLNEMRQGYENSLRDPISSFADSVMADALRPPSTVRANEIIGSTLDPKGLMYIREKLTTKYSAQDTNINNTTPSKSQGLVNDRCKDAAGGNTIPYAPSNLPIKADSNLNKLIGETRECPGNIEKTLLASNTQVTKSVPLESHLLNSGKCYPHSENEPFNDTLGSSRGLINPSNVPQIPGNIIPSQEHCPKSNDTLSGRLCNESATHAPHLCKAEKQAQGKLSSSSIPTNLLHSEELYNQVFPHEPINIMKEQNVPNVEHLRGAIEEMTLESSGPQKCNKCAEDIRIGDVVVVTDKAKNAGWHPGCFVCDVCNELLADLVYFHYKNKLYCGRDLATLLGIPRCFACDELIFVREYTVAEGHNYHVKHFCCWDCDVPLAGQQYITENDRPLCLPCYQTTYAKTCNACNGVIAANQQGVSVKDLDFHASESCFCCYECKKNLLNCRMAIKEGRLFCSKECISSFLVSRE